MCNFPLPPSPRPCTCSHSSRACPNSINVSLFFQLWANGGGDGDGDGYIPSDGGGSGGQGRSLRSTSVISHLPPSERRTRRVLLDFSKDVSEKANLKRSGAQVSVRLISFLLFFPKFYVFLSFHCAICFLKFRPVTPALLLKTSNIATSTPKKRPKFATLCSFFCKIALLC